MKDNFDHYAWNQKRHLAEGLNDRIGKIEIIYTEPGQGRRLYAVKIDDSVGKRIDKVYQDDANAILRYLGIEGELPRSLDFGDDKLLDSIVKQLQDMGIEADWCYCMDGS